MKKTAMLIMAVLAFVTTTIAAEPVDAAKNKALAEKLMDTLKISEAMTRSFDMVKKMQLDMMAKRLKGKQLQNAEKLNKTVMELVTRELSWEKLKGPFINLYAESFTAEELDAMIKFYESPIGKKLLEKQPEMARKSMQMMQEIMMKLMPEIEKITKDFEEQNKADAAKAAPSVAAPATPEVKPAPAK